MRDVQACCILPSITGKGHEVDNEQLVDFTEIKTPLHLIKTSGFLMKVEKHDKTIPEYEVVYKPRNGA